MTNRSPLSACLGIGLLTVSLAHPAPAQVQEVWRASFDAAFPPNPADAAGSVAIAPSGAIYQTGTARAGPGSPSMQVTHVIVTRRSAGGVLLWNRIEPPGGFPQSSPTAIAVTSQDTVVVAGTTVLSFGPATARRILFRYDANGSLVSSSVEGSNNNNYSAGLRLASNDDAIVAGMDDNRFVVERIDTAGSLVWRQTLFSLPTTFQSWANALTTNASDEIWTVGVHDSASTVSAAVARLGPGGNLQWTTEWPGWFAVDVAVDDHDQAYVCLMRDSAGPFQKAILALDPQGGVRWITDLPGLTQSPQISPRVRLDRFGRIVVVGQRNASIPHVGLWILRTDGALVLDREWNAASLDSEYAGSFEFGSSDEIVASASRFFGTSQSQQVLMAWDPAGRERWSWQSAWISPTGSIDSSARLLATDGTTIIVSETTPGTPSNSTDIGLTRLRRTAAIVCVGSTDAASCPCANGTRPMLQAGCATSQGTGGHLFESGASSLANDTLVLNGSDMPDSSVIYLQGMTALGGGSGITFGDGLRCVGGAVIRIAERTNQSGASGYPGAGEAPISTVGAVAAPSTRVYQAWFRNAAAFCTPATFNLTNGLSIEWVP